MSFTIAIIGRPNVGKSTLFNRLVGQKLALVDDEPGVTRDRREGEGRLGDLEFTLIDTAGLDEGAKGSLTARSEEHTSELQSQSNLVCRLLLEKKKKYVNAPSCAEGTTSDEFATTARPRW